MDDLTGSYAMYCPDCEVLIFEDEDGFDAEECIECGECNLYEVPA